MNAASLRRARTVRSRIMYLSLVLGALTVYPVALKHCTGLGGPGSLAVCRAASSVVADCNASQGFESSSPEQGSVQVAGGDLVLLLHKMVIGLPGLFAQFFLYMTYIFFDLYTFRLEMKALNQHVKVLEDQLESLEKSTSALVYRSLQRFYEVGGTTPAFAEAWSMQKVLP